jgi:myosin heavy subunit
LRKEWRALVQRQKDEKQKRATMVIIKKYRRKRMAKHAFMKLLSATTSIKYCCRQVHARKELQRLQQDAKKLSIKHVGDSTKNHLEDRWNDMIKARSNSRGFQILV